MADTPSNREGLTLAIFLIAVAIIGKVVTGLTVFGQPGINRLAIGVGMIPRGEVGLVFAGVGSASGALSEAMEAAIIMMVILTTFIASPLLRLVFQKPEGVSTQAAVPSLDAGTVGATAPIVVEQIPKGQGDAQESETAQEPK